MIGRLRGQILEKQPPLLVLEVSGVGYEVEAPMSTFYQLPDLNQEIQLFTHLIVREDAHILFGFASESERQLFRYLIKINGVGPKLALSILSAMDLEAFVQAIQQQDTARLSKIPGIGKKTAERLIIEMRDRLATPTTQSPATSTAPAVNSLTQGMATPVEDAISALIALGYKPAEATKLVQAVAEAGDSSETLIRKALQKAV